MFKEKAKRMISTAMVTLSVVAASIVPLVSGQDVLAARVLNHTRDEAVAWCKQQIGKAGTNYDNVNGVQCVDLARLYTNWLGVDIGAGNAYEYCTKSLPDGYSRYGNSTAPQAGDIFVMDRGAYNSSKQWGHIGVIYEVGSNYYKYIDYLGSTHRGAIGTTQNSKQSFSKIIRPNFKTATSNNNHPTTATISNGTYMLRNVGTNYAMNYAYGTSGNPVWMSKYGDENKGEQHFKFTYDGNGKYKIETCYSLGYVVNCECNNPVYKGAKITIRKYTNNDTQKFYVKQVGNGQYILQSASNPNLVIGAPNGNFHAKLELQTYSKGNKNQIWTLNK